MSVDDPINPPEAAAGRPNITPGYGIATDAEGLLPWSYVRERMLGSRNYWIGTTRPNGRPHVAPVWGLWLDEAFLFSTDPISRKGRNLAANPEMVVNLESGDEVVILEGRAERVRDEATLLSIVDPYEAKYGVRLDVTNPDFAFFRLRARVAYAWRERDYPQSATRWILGTD